MKFAVLIMACVAAVSAQFNNNRATTSKPFAQFVIGTGKQDDAKVPPATVAPARVAPAKVAPTKVAPAKVAPATVTIVKVAPNVNLIKYVPDRYAKTIKYDNEINPDGGYYYSFETDNGIAAQAKGTPVNFGGDPPVIPDVASGSFSWIAPNGRLIAITYVADENGYRPSGDAIPTPPPVPEPIARALAYLAKNGQKK